MRNKPADDLRPEYDFDFSKAERGCYADRLKTEGSNLVLVEPELAKSFPDSASVNAALRSVVEFAKLSAGLTRRSSSPLQSVVPLKPSKGAENLPSP